MRSHSLELVSQRSAPWTHQPRTRTRCQATEFGRQPFLASRRASPLTGAVPTPRSSEQAGASLNVRFVVPCIQHVSSAHKLRRQLDNRVTGRRPLPARIPRVSRTGSSGMSRLGRSEGKLTTRAERSPERAGGRTRFVRSSSALYRARTSGHPRSTELGRAVHMRDRSLAPHGASACASRI